MELQTYKFDISMSTTPEAGIKRLKKILFIVNPEQMEYIVVSAEQSSCILSVIITEKDTQTIKVLKTVIENLLKRKNIRYELSKHTLSWHKYSITL